ncbi:MAG: hypothetical protein ABIJ16_13215 [Bacteroidota bacterium]
MKKFRYYQASLNLEVFLRFIKMFPGKTVNILLSFAMLNHEVSDFLHTYRDKIGKIILDSGTWTLNKAQESVIKWITLDNYRCYLMRFGHLFHFYINFDSDFTESGTEINQYNQMVLEDAGLNPVPVVHDIYGPEIDQYIQAGYKRIALGSSQIRTQRDMAHVMRRLDGTGIKIHTLGKSGFKLLAYFPISSSDSAMWARDGGYGYLRWWNPKREGDDKADRIYMQEFLSTGHSHEHLYFTYEFKEDFDAYLLNIFGLKYYDFFGRGFAYNKMLVNMYYYVQLEEEINKMHQKFGF